MDIWSNEGLEIIVIPVLRPGPPRVTDAATRVLVQYPKCHRLLNAGDRGTSFRSISGERWTMIMSALSRWLIPVSGFRPVSLRSFPLLKVCWRMLAFRQTSQ